MIARHPVIGPRYGPAIVDLASAWLRLLDLVGGAKFAVLEELKGTKTTICFVGVSVFANDDFLKELKTPPLFWVGPELAKRTLRGPPPFLSSKQLREANSNGGLNLLTWEGCIRPGFEKNTELHRVMLNSFIEQHRGYLWKEVIAPQLEGVERLEWTLKTGGLAWNPALGCYEESLAKTPREFLREPHIVGVTRNIEHARAGSWVGALFDYRPPQVGFSSAEQRLLLAALSGKTDAKLSDDLGTSISTVKNTWRSIYNRVASRLPDLFPDRPHAEAQDSNGGREKRRQLLTYLRERPEELRPVSKKLLLHPASANSNRLSKKK
jgi:hypothetical protein